MIAAIVEPGAYVQPGAHVQPRGDGPGAPETTVAWLLAQAEILPGVRDRAERATVAFDAQLAALGRDPDPSRAEDLARLLVDADIVSAILESGEADQAQRSASAAAQSAVDVDATLSPEQRCRAVEAAGVLARLRCLVAPLARPDYAERVQSRAAHLRESVEFREPAEFRESAQLCQSAQLPVATLLAGPVRSAARIAARARAAAGLLAAAQRERATTSITRRRRQDRSAELAERLVASAQLPGVVDALPEAPADDDLLTWLRSVVGDQRLYQPEPEEAAARAWLGSDLFGHRRPSPRPSFLAEVDVRALPPQLVAPFLRRLSLTNPEPTVADLTPEALAADRGAVSGAERDRHSRAWAGDVSAPVPLPAVVEIPRVVHGIWLGRPLPYDSVFWKSYAHLAHSYRGQLDVVIWTDLVRGALDTPAAREMVDWARAHGIHLVNPAEVFHADAPMVLAAPYAMELGRGVPAGFASASDHLRVEIIYRFGGLYADGDVIFPREGVPDLLDRVAASPQGFALHTVGSEGVCNDLIAAPAGHPALALWRELGRMNYLGSIFALVGEVPPDTARRSAWTWTNSAARSGRVHHQVLYRLGLQFTDLVEVPPTIRFGSELSWVAPAGGEPSVPHPEGADVLPTLQRGIAYLRWQLQTRLGDLHLTGFDPVIRGLPDPDVAWAALLRAMPALSRDLLAVASVTTARRYDNGLVHEVALPPAAQAMLLRSGHRWLGTGRDGGRGQLWVMDECLSPVRLAGQVPTTSGAAPPRS